MSDQPSCSTFRAHQGVASHTLGLTELHWIKVEMLHHLNPINLLILMIEGTNKCFCAWTCSFDLLSLSSTCWSQLSVRYLSQVEEEAGVLPGFRQVGQEHGDADQQHRGVFPHPTQRLNTPKTQISINRSISQRRARQSCNSDEKTHGEGVGLLPGDGEPPGRQPHLVRQRLGDDEEHERNICHSNHRGNKDHQAVSVLPRQVDPDGRTRHQAGREGRRDLAREGRLNQHITHLWPQAQGFKLETSEF